MEFVSSYNMNVGHAYGIHGLGKYFNPHIEMWGYDVTHAYGICFYIVQFVLTRIMPRSLPAPNPRGPEPSGNFITEVRT